LFEAKKKESTPRKALKCKQALTTAPLPPKSLNVEFKKKQEKFYFDCDPDPEQVPEAFEMPDHHHNDKHFDSDAAQEAATRTHNKSNKNDEDSSELTDGAELTIQLEPNSPANLNRRKTPLMTTMMFQMTQHTEQFSRKLKSQD
jgi:hypothetical protein